MRHEFESVEVNGMFLSEKIDKGNPTPMYYQLKLIILDMIDSSKLKPGDKIPTENELVEMFSVSRTTVRQAIAELTFEGYLERKKGKGTFVTQPKPLQDFMRSLGSFNDQIGYLGMTPSTKVLMLKPVSATKQVADKLNVKVGEKVFFLRRLRYADGEPMVLVDTYLPSSCSVIFDRDLEKESLYQILSSSHTTRVVKAVRQFEATISDNSLGTLLETGAGSPLLLVKTVGYNANDEAIEYSVANYVGSKSHFVVQVSI